MTDLETEEACDGETWLPFDTADAAEAAGFTSGTLSNGDTFGDEDDPNPSHWLYDARCDADLLRGEIARLTSSLNAASLSLKPNFTPFDDGFVETVTEDTLTVWSEIERPAYIEVGRSADGRIIGLRIYNREITDELTAAKISELEARETV